MLTGAVLAVSSYVVYAIAMTARERLGLLIFFPILFIYSPVSGIYSFLAAQREKSLRHSLPPGIILVVLFEALTVTDSVLRGDLGLSRLLLEFFPALTAALLLWILAGTLFSGTSELSIRLDITGRASSHVLSMILFSTGVILWYFGVWIPFVQRFSH